MNKKEQWKSVIHKDVDYTGLYQISNLGRVKSFVKYKSGHILKPWSNGNHYSISLHKNGIQTKAKVHVLVGVAFVGKKQKGEDYDHVDDNPLNNCATNLQILTHRDNTGKGRNKGRSLPVGMWISPDTGLVRVMVFANKNARTVHLGSYKTLKTAKAIYKYVLSFIELGNTLTKNQVQDLADDYRKSIGIKKIRRCRSPKSDLLEKNVEIN